MVSTLTLARSPVFTTPLDVLEDVLYGKEWPFDRPAEEEVIADIPGSLCDMRLWAVWREDSEALMLSCSFGLRVPAQSRLVMHSLLAQANERLWLGHFDLCSEEGTIGYRHTLLVPAITDEVTAQIDTVLDTARQECERFYPALQAVLWGGKKPQEALEFAMFDTVGEA